MQAVFPKNGGIFMSFRRPLHPRAAWRASPPAPPGTPGPWAGRCRRACRSPRRRRTAGERPHRTRSCPSGLRSGKGFFSAVPPRPGRTRSSMTAISCRVTGSSGGVPAAAHPRRPARPHRRPGHTRRAQWPLRSGEGGAGAPGAQPRQAAQDHRRLAPGEGVVGAEGGVGQPRSIFPWSAASMM